MINTPCDTTFFTYKISNPIINFIIQLTTKYFEISNSIKIFNKSIYFIERNTQWFFTQMFCMKFHKLNLVHMIFLSNKILK